MQKLIKKFKFENFKAKNSKTGKLQTNSKNRMENADKAKTPSNGKKQARQREIEAKKDKKAAAVRERRKRLYNARRIAAAAVMLFVIFIAVMIMKAFHRGPIMPAPEYRQIGNGKAITEIYEYTDLACPACAMANEKLHEILSVYGDKIKLNFKHFPLEMHRWASLAALHADCAGEQGKFFQYADLLFKNQKDWEDKEKGPTEFMVYAEKLGLDKEKMQICLANPDNAERIRLEKAEGNAKGVEATPTFIINGKLSIGAGAIIQEAQRLEKISKEAGNNEK